MSLIENVGTIRPGDTGGGKKRSRDTISSDGSHDTGIRIGRQQWTELTAVCHVFADEVHRYIHPLLDDSESSASAAPQVGKKSSKSSVTPLLSMGEKRHLAKLVARVRQRVEEESSRCLINRRLVLEAKVAKAKMRQRQNDIMITRLMIGRAEGEVAALDRQVRQAKRHNRELREANKLLSAVETLAGKGDRSAAES